MWGGRGTRRIETGAHDILSSTNFLEYAFLKWVLSPAVMPELYRFVSPQREVEVEGRHYLIDYEISGSEKTFAIELDGYGPHSGRLAFSHDRMRQTDLVSTGRVVMRFSYDSIRNETARCVRQLQDLLLSDPLLANFVVADPVVASPEMDPDPSYALKPSPIGGDEHMQSEHDTYFDTVRHTLNKKTLRECQTQAFEALADYYTQGGETAACVMSVGSGETALGVSAVMGFSRRRALVVTPGSVISGVIEKAFNHTVIGNILNYLSCTPK